MNVKQRNKINLKIPTQSKKRKEGFPLSETNGIQICILFLHSLHHACVFTRVCWSSKF